MKYKGFKYLTSWTWFVIFPTITLLFNDRVYMHKNLAIEIHWLGFHLRWFWIKEYWK